jgi:hypothetical protein
MNVGLMDRFNQAALQARQKMVQPSQNIRTTEKQGRTSIEDALAAINERSVVKSKGNVDSLSQNQPFGLEKSIGYGRNGSKMSVSTKNVLDYSRPRGGQLDVVA